MPKKITVYSTSTCSFCIRLKEFLKENNFDFENKDVALDQVAAEEMMSKSSQMGVPVVDVEGEIIVGFDKDKIKQALGMK